MLKRDRAAASPPGKAWPTLGECHPSSTIASLNKTLGICKVKRSDCASAAQQSGGAPFEGPGPPELQSELGPSDSATSGREHHVKSWLYIDCGGNLVRSRIDITAFV